MITYNDISIGGVLHYIDVFGKRSKAIDFEHSTIYVYNVLQIMCS